MVTIVRESESDTGAERVPVYTDAEAVKTKFDAINTASEGESPTVDDDAIGRLIIMAEEVVDELIGYHKKYHSKFSTTDEDYAIQHTKFPREKDFRLGDDGEEIPYIPYEIEDATLYLVEAFFNQIYSTDAGSVSDGTISPQLQKLLKYGGSVKITDFAFTVGAQKKAGEASTGTTTIDIKDWVLGLDQGRYIWSILNKYTNFTATFD